MSSGPRILQVLADTDASPEHLRGIDLHAALAAAGGEVRTVALAPGRTGALANIVPAVAPARRSLAAFTALRNEAKWADAVLFHGCRALPPGVDRSRALPAVLLRLVAGEPVPERRLARLAARGPLTLLIDEDAPVPLAAPPAGARRTVVPRDASASTAAGLVLAALDVRRPSAP